jgi:NAD(P)-dependent dehydrogenase (short-subunit alcohol dehydrogenase family)
LPVRLDVTNRDASFAAVTLAHDHFGRLDVIVNNAGYGQFGGDPVATRDAVLKLVDTPNPPLRLFLGSGQPPSGAEGPGTPGQARPAAAQDQTRRFGDGA